MQERNRTMKRIIAALLAGLCLLALVGCSSGKKADPSTPKDYSQILHDARNDDENETDMIFTKGEDGKFTAIDGYSAEYEADQLDDEIKNIMLPLLNLEDDMYTDRGMSGGEMISCHIIHGAANAMYLPRNDAIVHAQVA